MLRDFVFDRLGRNIVARVEDNQIFNATNNAPIAARIYFALISSVKPAVAQHALGFLRAIPIAGKDMRSANDNLFAIRNFHFNAGNRLAHIARLDRHARSSSVQIAVVSVRP